MKNSTHYADSIKLAVEHLLDAMSSSENQQAQLFQLRRAGSAIAHAAEESDDETSEKLVNALSGVQHEMFTDLLAAIGKEPS